MFASDAQWPNKVDRSARLTLDLDLKIVDEWKGGLLKRLKESLDMQTKRVNAFASIRADLWSSAKYSNPEYEHQSESSDATEFSTSLKQAQAMTIYINHQAIADMVRQSSLNTTSIVRMNLWHFRCWHFRCLESFDDLFGAFSQSLLFKKLPPSSSSCQEPYTWLSTWTGYHVALALAFSSMFRSDFNQRSDHHHNQTLKK